MKPSLLTTFVISSLAFSHLAQADDLDRYLAQEEQAAAIGLGSGVVIGALVGGPIGAGVAGVLGALIGKDTAREETLAYHRNELTHAQQSLFALRDQIDSMERDAMATHVTMVETDIQQTVMALESSVQFTTGSFEIVSAYQNQLNLIADALSENPQLQVRLTGHADNRGDKQYNQALSMQRALSVKQFLNKQGVADSQIVTLAEGENDSRAEQSDTLFFDRRVVIQILQGEQAMTAQR